MKRIIRLIGGGLVLILALQLASFAGDKSFFIKGSDITRAGGNLTTDKIEFFKNGSPLTLLEVGGAPLSEAIQIINGSVKAPTTAGRNVQYDATITDSLLAIIWTPNIGAGNYYAKTTLSMTQTNYDNSTLTWLWNNLKVDYKAVPPYQPIISQFEEATTSFTDGSPPVSTLKVTSVAGTGGDGLREVTGYAWKMWEEGQPEPATPLPGATDDVLSLDSNQVTTGVTYAFKAGHSNQWGGPTWSDKYTHKVAAVVAVGGPITTTYNLHKEDPGLGINSISFPFTNVTSPGAIANVKDLIETINDQAGENIVTTYGWYDKDIQAVAGYVVNYKSNTVNDFESFTNVGDAPADPANKALVKDGTYQVSVLKDAQVTLTGTR